MKVQKNNVRRLHVGKSKQEKNAYQNFLNQDFSLDQTAPKEKTLESTDTSTYEKEDYKEITNKQKKSSTLIIKDFLRDNWISGIGISIVGALFVVVLGIWTDQKAFIIKTENLDKRVNANESLTKVIEDKINSIDKELNGLNISISKDIEYIQRELGIYSNQQNKN